MPKNRNRNQAEVTKRPRIPNYRNDELLAIVTEIYGGEHMLVKAEASLGQNGPAEQTIQVDVAYPQEHAQKKGRGRDSEDR